jgi:hypothetical protein
VSNLDRRYQDPAQGSTRISQSAIEKYLKCGVRYFLDREQPQRRTTVALALGTGVARAAEVALRAKQRGSSVPLADICDLAVAEYDSAASSAEDGSRAIALGRNDAARAAEEFGLRVEPTITEIVAVEEPVVVELATGLELAGTPDVITQAGVGDLKTGQPWTQDRADKARQLTAYSLLYYARQGALPSRVWIDSIGHTGRAWRAERLWSSRTEAQLRSYVEIVRRVCSAIAQGTAVPAAEASWFCSPRWCPYYGRQCDFTRR